MLGIIGETAKGVVGEEKLIEIVMDTVIADGTVDNEIVV